MSEEVYHIPALLPETLEALNINPEGIYVDVTYGGGGHSRAIMEQLNAKGHLYSFDQDEDAVKRAMVDPRFTIVYSNFRFLSNFLEYHKVEAVDGILGDVGVSFHHFDDKDRGFSFRFEGALDMRMNQRAKRTAAWIVMNYSEEQLADVFYLYGELKNSRKLASAIVKARNQSPIETVERLLEVVKPLINPRQEKKELAMLFQALRIEVNGEIDVLKRLLQQSLEALKPGGRLAIITYHSLEDRLVKNFMRTGNLRGELEKDFFGRSMSPFKLLNAKPIVPSDQEVELNPRSRSAKLRVAEKL
ncbi:MAG: 16S rRNA (cytosine(1402)-N(4))-methyltransferase RsmH [Muribaculaceae bacterium]|nr:16S rRNA (cytosine(1402)-N(4))-methyltransferase RsmH [Muribaculaceae bacterium]